MIIPGAHHRNKCLRGTSSKSENGPVTLATWFVENFHTMPLSLPSIRTKLRWIHIFVILYSVQCKIEGHAV